MFFLQLSQFKRWLVREPTNVERTLICRTLAGMHWSLHMSHKGDKPVEVRWLDCGFDRPSLCLLPEEPTTRFAYARPGDHRDPVPADERFLRACGVRIHDLRDVGSVLICPFC
jgi:hypothetical protein